MHGIFSWQSANSTGHLATVIRSFRDCYETRGAFVVFGSRAVCGMRKTELERARGRGARGGAATGPGGADLGKTRHIRESTINDTRDPARHSACRTDGDRIAARTTCPRKAKSRARANRKRLQGVQRHVGKPRDLTDAVV
jgi:hypothetical protein